MFLRGAEGASLEALAARVDLVVTLGVRVDWVGLAVRSVAAGTVMEVTLEEAQATVTAVGVGSAAAELAAAGTAAVERAAVGTEVMTAVVEARVGHLQEDKEVCTAAATGEVEMVEEAMEVEEMVVATAASKGVGWAAATVAVMAAVGLVRYLEGTVAVPVASKAVEWMGVVAAIAAVAAVAAVQEVVERTRPSRLQASTIDTQSTSQTIGSEKEQNDRTGRARSNVYLQIAGFDLYNQSQPRRPQTWHLHSHHLCERRTARLVLPVSV